MENLTIGNYKPKAAMKCRLTALRTGDLSRFIESMKGRPECPYDKDTDKTKYKDWKSKNLPLLFFTMSAEQPGESDDTVFPSGFALIDIDDAPGKKYSSGHPCVFAANYTKNGTHLLVHAGGWGRTPMEWHDNYNRVAYEVVKDLWNTYKEPVSIDRHLSRHYWGCYLWNTEWEFNGNFDPEWSPDPDIWPTDAQLDAVYGKYVRPRLSNAVTKLKNGKRVREDLPDMRECISELNRMSGVSAEAANNLWSNSYYRFCGIFSKKYDIVYGSEPDFEDMTTWDGRTFEACDTKGSLVRIWYPFYDRENPRIRKGNRSSSLYHHLLRVCALTGGKDPDYILYDAVNWVYNCCEDPDSFSKTRVLGAVNSVLKNWESKEIGFTTDRRRLIAGRFMTDSETGEATAMGKEDKISLLNRLRKTSRMREFLSLFDPSESIADNISRIRGIDRDVSSVSEKTLASYLKAASESETLSNEFPWLKTYRMKEEKKGRPSKTVSIQVIETGETIVFESVKECMAYLNTNKKTYSKFLKGRSKLNGFYTVLKDKEG